MKALYAIIRQFRNNANGQDLLEYALMAGFIAVAAAVTIPGVSTQISTVLSKVGSVLTASASQS
jgi:pilus assembly protein Flp/PilA